MANSARSSVTPSPPDERGDELGFGKPVFLGQFGLEWGDLLLELSLATWSIALAAVGVERAMGTSSRVCAAPSYLTPK